MMRCVIRSGKRAGVFVGLSLAAATCHAWGQTYRGELERTLQVDTDSGSLLLWHRASPDLAKSLNLAPEELLDLYQGRLDLGTKPALQFGAAIASLKDGTRLLFLDRKTGAGRLQQVESHRLGASPQSFYTAQLTFDVPLPYGLFRSVPVFVALPKDTGGYPLKPGEFAVIAGTRPYIAGTVALPDRKLLVRYAYDVDTASIPLKTALEWFDTDGDGHIDSAPGSPEQGVPDKAAPVFNVGNLALQTAAVDVARRSFLLRQVPPDNRRFNLTVGSRLPDFAYRDFSGRQHRFSEIRAKYTLLDFWATWCVPCVADLPSKREAYARFHAKGFQILGINGDVDQAKPEALLAKMQATWPEAKRDPELLQERFKITSWPTLLLLDEAGTIVSTNQPGQFPLSGAQLQKTLEKLLP